MTTTHTHTCVFDTTLSVGEKRMDKVTDLTELNIQWSEPVTKHEVGMLSNE